MSTTLTGLTPAGNYSLFPGAKVSNYANNRQMPPGTAPITGAADATGKLTVTVPTGIEQICFGPDPIHTGETLARRVLESTTKGGKP